MSPRKTPPTPLQGFHNVKQATVKLGMATEDPADKRGQRWLRDGVNREHNPFPCHRMSGYLLFSDDDLAEIAAMHRNVPTRAGRPRSRRRLAAAA
ncbi:hypothetical protein [Streptomyces sp. NPDC005167]